MQKQLATKDDNGVLYGEIAGKSISEIKFKVPNHNTYRYVAVTNAGDRCYITHTMEICNADYTFKTKNIEVSKQVLCDRNGVPYFLNEQAINNKLPTCVTKIITKDGLPGNMKYLAELDNGEKCYIAGDPNTKANGAFDACGNSNYDNIKCDQELITKFDKANEPKQDNGLSTTAILVIVGVVGIIIIGIVLAATGKKGGKKNKKKASGGYYNDFGNSCFGNPRQNRSYQSYGNNYSNQYNLNNNITNNQRNQPVVTEVNDVKNSEFYRQQAAASMYDDL